ncbi:hypothetical protein MTO96_025337 [Rhipicephalus appendiculatus]
MSSSGPERERFEKARMLQLPTVYSEFVALITRHREPVSARSPHGLSLIPPTTPWPGHPTYPGSYSLALYLATHLSMLQSRSADFSRAGTRMSHHNIIQLRRPGYFVRSAESHKFHAVHIRTAPSTAAASLR